MIIVDADDFHEDNHNILLLEHIKQQIPDFKITLFTVIGKSDHKFIETIQSVFDWVDMVPHGMFHTTPYECSYWSYEYCMDYLNYIEQFNLTKGFKAPGWQISDGCYQALLEHGYWVADQAYNKFRRPEGLKVYELDAPFKYHYHVQDVCGNGLEESLQQILTLKGDFQFIKDYVKAQYGTH